MIQSLIAFSWPIAIVIAAGAAYVFVVKPKTDAASQSVGKADTVAATTTWWQAAWAKLDGWKTPALSLVAGVVQVIQLIPSDVLSEWQTLPWGVVFDASVANKISAACAILIAISHSVGLAKAAKTEPQV